jgi:hypothetical protein
MDKETHRNATHFYNFFWWRRKDTGGFIRTYSTLVLCRSEAHGEHHVHSNSTISPFTQQRITHDLYILMPVTSFEPTVTTVRKWILLRVKQCLGSKLNQTDASEPFCHVPHSPLSQMLRLYTNVGYYPIFNPLKTERNVLYKDSVRTAL